VTARAQTVLSASAPQAPPEIEKEREGTKAAHLKGEQETATYETGGGGEQVSHEKPTESQTQRT